MTPFLSNDETVLLVETIAVCFWLVLMAAYYQHVEEWTFTDAMYFSFVSISITDVLGFNIAIGLPNLLIGWPMFVDSHSVIFWRLPNTQTNERNEKDDVLGMCGFSLVLFAHLSGNFREN